MQAQNNAVIIKSIEIIRADVFTPGDKELNGMPRFLNNAHPLTKERVIERELLFHNGDTLDLQLISESERRLRDFSFLGSAEIKIDTISSGAVEVTVRTSD